MQDKSFCLCQSVDRRTVLRGFGVSIALPLMESLSPRMTLAAEGASRAQRMAVVTGVAGVAQIFSVRANGRERSPVSPNRGAHPIDDPSFSHGSALRE